MVALLLVVVLQAAATASPGLPPEWTIAPAQDAEEYVRYNRHEQDGTDSAIFARRRVCNCQPAEAVQLVQDAFQKLAGTTTKHDSIVACGHDAERVLVTGVANQQDERRRNIEVVWFRVGAALYTLTYTFRYASPMPDAEDALITLCPQVP